MFCAISGQAPEKAVVSKISGHVYEASLLENLQSPLGEEHPPARATVVAAPGCWYVRWPQSVFYELQMEEDSDFGYAIQLMIARTLSAKLATKRESQRESEARLRLLDGSVGLEPWTIRR